MLIKIRLKEPNRVRLYKDKQKQNILITKEPIAKGKKKTYQVVYNPFTVYNGVLAHDRIGVLY